MAANPMIEKTQRRVRQARFFYQHLLNPRQSTNGDPEAFRFYFSAFIQSARSVTWTLGKEEPDKWKAWEPKWKDRRTEEEKDLLRIATKLRNVEVKEGGADLTMELEEVAVDALIEAIPSGRAAYPHQRRRLPGALTKKTIQINLPFHYFEDKKGKQEITAVCRRYLELLEKMIEDFCSDVNLREGNS